MSRFRGPEETRAEALRALKSLAALTKARHHAIVAGMPDAGGGRERAGQEFAEQLEFRWIRYLDPQIGVPERSKESDPLTTASR